MSPDSAISAAAPIVNLASPSVLPVLSSLPYFVTQIVFLESAPDGDQIIFPSGWLTATAFGPLPIIVVTIPAQV